MKKNVLSSMFLGVILISLFLLASCRPEEKVVEAAGVAASASTPFDYERAADNQAARWLAMASYYEENGLLNTPSESGVVYAMDAVDFKLYNAAETPATFNAGITYAMDLVDLKLFNTADTATFGLASVDPADRKFFAGIYRGGNGNDIPVTIHPADRKFFTSNNVS